MEHIERPSAARIIPVVLLLAGFLPMFAFADEGRITVSKVRFIVSGGEAGELVYEWIDELPLRAEGGTTDPVGIASFLDFKPGDAMTEAELSRRCDAARVRLMESGFFYAADVSVIPPRTFPERRSVLITLSEGMLWRFGGGYAFAMVGKDNVSGRRKSWRAVAGYNLCALHLEDQLFLDMPLGLNAGAQYRHTLGTPEIEFHEFSAHAGAHWRFHPDFSIGLSADAFRRFYTDGVNGEAKAAALYPGTASGLYLRPRAEITGTVFRHASVADLRLEFNSGAFLALAAVPDATEDANPAVDGQLALRADLGPVELAAKGAAGAYLSTLDGSATMAPPEPFLWNLASTPDRSVRAGTTVAELMADRFVYSSIEARLQVLRFPFPPVFAVSVEPFLFADVALTARTGSYAYAFNEAFGCGVRVLFENPVFAYFTFNLGTDFEGRPRFGMTGTAGY